MNAGLSVAFFFTCLASAVAHASTDDNDIVSRLEALEQRVVRLEHLLAARNADTAPSQQSSSAKPTTTEPADSPRGASTDAIVPAAAWQDAKNWDRLEPGMSVDQTEAILGRPIYSVRALKARVDHVRYYATSMRTMHLSSAGELEFYKDKLVDFRAPASE